MTYFIDCGISHGNPSKLLKKSQCFHEATFPPRLANSEFTCIAVLVVLWSLSKQTVVATKERKILLKSFLVAII